MASIPTITKDNAVILLPQFIEVANSKGAFLLREASLLKKACDYVKPEVKNKPQFIEDDANPRATALRLLLQGAHKAQSQGSFLLHDSAALFEICELVTKELEDTEKKGGAGNVTPVIHKEEEEDDDTVDVRSVSVTKGKARQ